MPARTTNSRINVGKSTRRSLPITNRLGEMVATGLRGARHRANDRNVANSREPNDETLRSPTTNDRYPRIIAQTERSTAPPPSTDVESAFEIRSVQPKPQDSGVTDLWPARRKIGKSRRVAPDFPGPPPGAGPPDKGG
ncbi:hypothetical protein [Dactylosporangium sp. NPDC049140]|uniref:hypothetical protein n=1 Tax=Dactylosporangium sp. NPDC049140 TaxID=3155647 RepID=UPI003410B4C2